MQTKEHHCLFAHVIVKDSRTPEASQPLELAVGDATSTAFVEASLRL
jgi:hypothetical protein